MIYFVQGIPKEQTYPWLLKKHYAHRIPSISYSFGLYDDTKKLVGVCTFGMPPNYVEMEAWNPYELLELNRLIVTSGLPKNTLSFFVGNCLKQLPKPKVIISYADFGMGHHGYIYQATNWVYTGIGGAGQSVFVMKDGTERHQRHGDTIDKRCVDHIEKTIGKARYYYFIGGKKDVREMRRLLRYPPLPYPKGDNKRYDIGDELKVQGVLL